MVSNPRLNDEGDGLRVQAASDLAAFRHPPQQRLPWTDSPLFDPGFDCFNGIGIRRSRAGSSVHR